MLPNNEQTFIDSEREFDEIISNSAPTRSLESLLSDPKSIKIEGLEVVPGMSIPERLAISKLKSQFLTGIKKMDEYMGETVVVIGAVQHLIDFQSNYTNEYLTDKTHTIWLLEDGTPLGSVSGVIADFTRRVLFADWTEDGKPGKLLAKVTVELKAHRFKRGGSYAPKVLDAQEF